MIKHRAEHIAAGIWKAVRIIPIAAVFFSVISCASSPKDPIEPEKPSIQQLILAGKTNQVRALFETQTDINTVDENGNSALHAAAQINDGDLVSFLLHNGADPELKNYSGDAPLHTAVKNRASKAAAALTAFNANVFSKDGEGQSAAKIALTQGSLFYEALFTPLTGQSKDFQGRTLVHYAVEDINRNAVDFCIKKGLPLSIKDSEGISPLALAYSQKDLDSVYIAAALIAANASPERGSYAYFEDAVKTHNLSMRFADGQSPLHFAVIAGETSIVRFLLEQGVSINAKDISGSTPLHEAVRYGRREIASLLLDAGADINARDSIGKTPLLIITPDESAQAVYTLLLERGAQANAVDTFGDNALHIATMTKSKTAVLETLAAKGAVVNGRNKKGITPLAQAVERKNTGHIAFFAQKGADIHAEDIQGNTPLTRSIEAGLAIVKPLINNENINSRDSTGNTPLHIAVYKKAPIEQIAFFLEKGADVNARNRKGDAPLYPAVQHNNRHAGELLLAKGADVFAANTANYSPLRLALSAGGEVQDWLLTSEVIRAADSMGNTPLHFAAEWQLNSAAAVLIEKGAPINSQNANGETASFYALQSDNAPLIKFFIKNGCDLNLRDYLGNTLLHAAVAKEAEQSVSVILKAADINAKNLAGKTPLHAAAGAGRLNMAELLLNAKADINASDITGKTPLMDAVQSGNKPMTKLLLERGASPSIQEMYGRTAYHAAAETGDTELIEAVRSAGGNPFARDIQGVTPLSLVLKKNIELIKSVLGSNINLADSDGNTAIHIAVQNNAPYKTLAALIDAGYPSDRRNREGFTPLLLAVRQNKTEAVRILLSKGADPFVTDNESKCAVSHALKQNGDILETIVKIAGKQRDITGESILHYAARESDAQTVQKLLSMGLDRTVKNIAGETPYDTAIRWKHNESAALLK